MKDLMSREQVIDTEYGPYRLQYRIHEIKDEGEIVYGVSISQFYDTEQEKGLFDYAAIRTFSESLKDAQAFFETLILERVFPVHLSNVADDWMIYRQSEFPASMFCMSNG